MEYFSDQQSGARERNIEGIPLSVWGGIVALIRKHWADGFFGLGFPEVCSDGGGVCGCNANNFLLAMSAEVPDIGDHLNPGDLPDTLAILDLIQFCYSNIAQATEYSYHSFFKHSHYNFDEAEGKRIFKDEIERLFTRNGIAYHLEDGGRIVRTISAALVPVLNTAHFNTGDDTLDGLLHEAREKFIDPDPSVRGDSLEKLWDAWERLKTLEDSDKKTSIKVTLDETASEPEFRKLLEEEARSLTNIGNTFKIRHSETTQVALAENAYVDYLFHRLFSMIELILRMTDRLR